MTKPRKIAVALAVVLLVGAVVAWWMPSNEPEYEGVTLSRWVAKYCLRYHVPEVESTNEFNRINLALRALGTNATGYLVSLSDCPADSPAFVQIRSQIRREIPAHLASYSERIAFARRVWEVRPRDIHAEADTALWELAPDADVLLPLLAPRFTSRDDAIRANAYRLLRTIGTNAGKAEPYLLQGLRDPNETNRMTTAISLGALKLKTPALARAMGEAIEKASPVMQLDLLYRAKSLWPVEKDALLAMLRVLERERDPVRRLKIASAICAMDATQPEALKVMIESMRDPALRVGAIQRLATLRPIPKIPGELLIEALRDQRVYSGNTVLADLVLLGPPKDEAIPLLMQAVATGNEYVQIEASLQLLVLAPNHGVAIGTLLKLAQLPNSSFDDLAVEALGKAGANATAAVPQLTQLLPLSPRARAAAIQSALGKIQSLPPPNISVPAKPSKSGIGD